MINVAIWRIASHLMHPEKKAFGALTAIARWLSLEMDRSSYWLDAIFKHAELG